MRIAQRLPSLLVGPALGDAAHHLLSDLVEVNGRSLLGAGLVLSLCLVHLPLLALLRDCASFLSPLATFLGPHTFASCLDHRHVSMYAMANG